MGIKYTFNQVQQKLLKSIQYEDWNYFSSQRQTVFFKTMPIQRNKMCNKSKTFGRDLGEGGIPWEVCSKFW